MIQQTIITSLSVKPITHTYFSLVQSFFFTQLHFPKPMPP